MAAYVVNRNQGKRAISAAEGDKALSANSTQDVRLISVPESSSSSGLDKPGLRWERVPYFIEIILWISCIAPRDRSGGRGCVLCAEKSKRKAFTAFRVINSIFQGLLLLVRDGEFPVLRSWFSLAGLLLWGLFMPLAVWNLWSFYECEDGRMHQNIQNLNRHMCRYQDEVKKLNILAATFLMVCTSFCIGGLFLLISDIGENDQYSRYLFVSRVAESQYNMSLFNESASSDILAQISEDVQVPAGLVCWWFISRTSFVLNQWLLNFPFFSALLVFIWYGMLQRARTQQMTHEIMDQITEVHVEESASIKQDLLLQYFENQVKEHAKAMKSIKKHLQPIGNCVVGVGLAFYTFTALDYVVPLQFMRPPKISSWIVITLCIAFFLLLISTIYFALAPSEAWRNFLVTMKRPRVVGKLRWCSLSTILEGWSEREVDYSWVLFGFPITLDTYIRIFFTILSIASIVVGVFVRSLW